MLVFQLSSPKQRQKIIVQLRSGKHMMMSTIKAKHGPQQHELFCVQLLKDSMVCCCLKSRAASVKKGSSGSVSPTLSLHSGKHHGREFQSCLRRKPRLHVICEWRRTLCSTQVSTQGIDFRSPSGDVQESSACGLTKQLDFKKEFSINNVTEIYMQ